METGYPQGVATLVALADGTTSLYFSNGGGVIGAGEQARVRAAAAVLISAAEGRLAEFVLANETPLPDVGRVRLYVRTFGSTLTAEAAEQDLAYGRHALSPVFHAGHAVIATVREAGELRQA